TGTARGAASAPLVPGAGHGRRDAGGGAVQLRARRRAHLDARDAPADVRDAGVLRPRQPVRAGALRHLLAEPADAVPGRAARPVHRPARGTGRLRARGRDRHAGAGRGLCRVPVGGERRAGADVSAPAVRLEHVAKRFLIPHTQRTTLRVVRSLLRREALRRELWALEDVSFTLEHGTRLALLGR